MTTPREHWADVADQYGVARTVGWCTDLLTGAVTIEDPENPAFNALGSGGHLQRILDGGSPDYWIRVWAARGLLYVWDDMAVAAVVAGLADEHWRVREMCAKVCRSRGLGEAGDDLDSLVADEVPRVRQAAVRALAGLGEAEHARVIRQAVNDVDVKVSSAAEATLDAMSERLDRDLRLDGDDL
ncbi:HEAT repeat domain-containing protein [Microlunatus sp. Gsoil 973]|uniref:HEAT repeat domain-containing protein n=1 Tax=Microlunatus sp. Gsoil 973 TaxID=2672569 RepID=UPI0012B46EB5|nr:HEAT repeat domain-containing protein [Microlunatus sp. Gsoil 973]QGN32540.1 HEAT repeat domain-containing protein [Microlunatus sp. Gsoil 973]